MARHQIQGSLFTETWLQAGRLLVRWRRDRALLLGSLLFPVAILVLYEVVLGEHVRKLTGTGSVYGLVPVCAVLSAVFGSLGNATSISVDRRSGLLSRMWVLPIHRTSPLIGRLTAEAIRALIGTSLITALGVILGLRFTNGLVPALVFFVVPSLVAIGFTALVMVLAVYPKGQVVMTWLVMVTIALAFINPGITPIGMFPDWIQPFVKVQPMSPPVEAMRSLAIGGPLLWPLIMTLIWTLVVFAVFVPLAVRGYRYAAQSPE